MIEDRLRQLSRIDLFSFLGSEGLKEIAPRVTFKEISKGEVILQEEDSTSFMYAIISGKVRVFQTAEDGKEGVLAIHGEGKLFGELSLIDGRTSPATVAATEDTIIALISRKDFNALLRNQKFLEGLLKSLCIRLRDSWKRIKLLGIKNAEERIRLLLLILSEESGSETSPDGLTLGLRLTHQNIADMAGLTRETVTRVIDKLIKKGEIFLDDQKRICLSNNLLKKASSL